MSDNLPRQSTERIGAWIATDLPAASMRLLAAAFDAEFYSVNYPDVQPRHRLLDHYLDVGWREGRNPSATFDTCYYLETNPDVRDFGICPLLHYVQFGAAEGRLPSPPPQYGWMTKAAAAFDADYYRETYKDIPAGIHLLQHYLRVGWREGRNPSADFDTPYYLEANPDVRLADICPLVHYLTRGADEGRFATRPVDPARAKMGSWSEVADRVRPWLQSAGPVQVAEIDLRAALEAVASDACRGIVVALSHDDYVAMAGGVQNCIGDEARAFGGAGFAYIHLCPAQPLPVLAECSDSDLLVSARLDGRALGTFSICEFAEALARKKSTASPLYLVIHHLMGFSPEAVLAAARILSPDETVVWTHDFFTLCSQFALMRNDAVFCHGPPVTSKMCQVCHYGWDREDHLGRIRSFFSALQPTVLAPSAVALQFWREHSNFEFRNSAAVPHARLNFDAEAQPPRLSYPLRIGFLGGPHYYKGWHVFEELAARHFNDRRYVFFHLGGTPGNPSRNIRFIRVAVNPGDRQAMVRAVIGADLDIVVNWSLCYETFCFTAHEAVAGGAFVITRRDAGNIWPALASSERARALDSEEELFDLFTSGRALELDLTKRYASLEPGIVTASYILGRPNG